MNQKLRRKTFWLMAVSTLLGMTLGTCQVTLHDAFVDSVRLSVVGLLNPANFGL